MCGVRSSRRGSRPSAPKRPTSGAWTAVGSGSKRPRTAPRRTKASGGSDAAEGASRRPRTIARPARIGRRRVRPPSHHWDKICSGMSDLPAHPVRRVVWKNPQCCAAATGDGAAGPVAAVLLDLVSFDDLLSSVRRFTIRLIDEQGATMKTVVVARRQVYLQSDNAGGVRAGEASAGVPWDCGVYSQVKRVVVESDEFREKSERAVSPHVAAAHAPPADHGSWPGRERD